MCCSASSVMPWYRAARENTTTRTMRNRRKRIVQRGIWVLREPKSNLLLIPVPAAFACRGECSPADLTDSLAYDPASQRAGEPLFPYRIRLYLSHCRAIRRDGQRPGLLKSPGRVKKTVDVKAPLAPLSFPGSPFLPRPLLRGVHAHFRKEAVFSLPFFLIAV